MDRGWGGRGGGVAGHSNATKLDLSLPPKPVTFESQAPSSSKQDHSDSESGSDSDSDGAPEVVSSKVAPPAQIPAQEDVDMKDADGTTEITATHETPDTKLYPQRRKPPPRQPRRPLHNPFASRPSLLRNVSIDVTLYIHHTCF